jgi:hypothetical protein
MTGGSVNFSHQRFCTDNVNATGRLDYGSSFCMPWVDKEYVGFTNIVGAFVGVGKRDPRWPQTHFLTSVSFLRENCMTLQWASSRK